MGEDKRRVENGGEPVRGGSAVGTGALECRRDAQGIGVYEPPTGRPVYVWGITQHVIKGGRISEEWMMFNEFEVMQQIYRE